MRYSFKKADRLLKRSEFVWLSRYGKKIHGRYFLAIFLPGTGAGNRLGVTVTKKVADAPGRNRIKRLVRESFRQNRHRISGNQDINVVAKRQAATMSSIEAFDDLTLIFSKISLLHDNQENSHSPLPRRH
jgi:ribonuclease P protein component